MHQVNLEYLARVVGARDGLAFPDTLVGTDSHTTMANGLGVLGWGVGGIEAEAAMLGEALSMLVPQVVGFCLSGELPEGATATDLVLTVTEICARVGVVGKFVEYFGHGLAKLPLADRATIGNMSPEYGATCGFFPVDEETLRYLRMTGRPAERVALVEAYCKEEGMLWHDPADRPTYSQVVELDLSTVEPSLAGPRRPQDRVPLAGAKAALPRRARHVRRRLRPARRGGRGHVPRQRPDGGPGAGPRGDRERAARARGDRTPRPPPRTRGGGRRELELDHGAVVIAAITSCTNTSNPSVMIGAGLLAKKAVEAGLRAQASGSSRASPRLEGRHRVLPSRGAHALPRGSSASTPSATAARPASATRGRCPRAVDAVTE